MRMARQSRFLGFAFAAVFILLFAAQARASSFPGRAVYIIVGVSPGGGVDTTARVLAEYLSKLWGQPVIVEDRPGAAGAIANEAVAKAAPDGYTLLLTSDDITALSAVRAHLPYDLLRDLTPVSLVATAPSVLVVQPSLPVHNVKELIALAKSEPGKLSYGSAGVGSTTHLQAARFVAMADINVVHVPYKGTVPSVVGVADGEIDMDIASQAATRGLIKAGKIRALGVSGSQRSPLFPDVPTISESGVPFVSTDWYGLLAPPGLPKDVLATLNAAIAKVVALPETKAALAKQGADAQADSPDQFAKLVGDDLAEKIKLAKLAGVQAQ